jgi:hypothetical protein
MRIILTKRGRRHRLCCQKADGTSTLSDLGPRLPHHDLAHFVVEQRFGLREGFFGHIARGYTPEQLSDKEVIKSLGRESLAGEILARALQSLSSGSCSSEQFAELVNTEFAQWAIPALHVSLPDVQTVRAEFASLIQRYAGLKDGERLTLDFDLR